MTQTHGVEWDYDGKRYRVILQLNETATIKSIGVIEPAETQRSRGAGDTFKKIIDKATLGKVKPCGGCKKRQAALNKMMPYKGDRDAN